MSKRTIDQGGNIRMTKKINYKKAYYKEKEYKEEYQDRYLESRKKYLFWFPFGVLFMVSFGLLFSYYCYMQLITDNYTIYKTECHNESRLLYSSIIQKSFYIDDNKTSFNVTNLSKFIKVKINGKDLEMSCKDSDTYITVSGQLVKVPDKRYSNCEFYAYEKACSQIEVNEILLDCNAKDYNAKDYPSVCIDYTLCLANCNSWAFHYIPTFKDDPEKYQCNCKPPTIQKKDIKKEWLNNNCKCTEFACKFGYKNFNYPNSHRKDCYTQFMINCLESAKGICSGKEGTDINKCSKYHCFDSYEVVI